MGEPIGVDDWGIVGVGGGNIDGAAGERRDEGDGDGGVVVAVVGMVGDEVSLVAEVTANVQILDLWPIGGEMSESVGGGIGEITAGGRRDLFPCWKRSVSLR